MSEPITTDPSDCNVADRISSSVVVIRAVGLSWRRALSKFGLPGFFGTLAAIFVIADWDHPVSRWIILPIALILISSTAAMIHWFTMGGYTSSTIDVSAAGVKAPLLLSFVPWSDISGIKLAVDSGNSIIVLYAKCLVARGFRRHSFSWLYHFVIGHSHKDRIVIIAEDYDCDPIATYVWLRKLWRESNESVRFSILVSGTEKV
jgi:hypothetical protein